MSCNCIGICQLHIDRHVGCCSMRNPSDKSRRQTTWDPSMLQHATLPTLRRFVTNLWLVLQVDLNGLVGQLLFFQREPRPVRIWADGCVPENERVGRHGGRCGQPAKTAGELSLLTIKSRSSLGSVVVQGSISQQHVQTHSADKLPSDQWQPRVGALRTASIGMPCDCSLVLACADVGYV